MITPDLATLEADLANLTELGPFAAAERLLSLGYRMPECPDRWQADRLAGALIGASFSSGYESTAQVLIEVVRLEFEDSPED